MIQSSKISTKEDISFFHEEKDNCNANNNKTTITRDITITAIILTIFSFATFARLNFVQNKKNNEHISSMQKTISDSLFDRESEFIKGNLYFHEEEDLLLSNFMNNHVPFIKKYATNKDYQEFTHKLKGKTISDIIQWEKNESKLFIQKSIEQKTKFDNILKNPQITQTLTQAVINNKTLSLHVKVSNQSPYNYNAIQGTIYIINIFEEEINKSAYSLVKNIPSGHTMEVIYDIDNFKKFDISPEELKNLNINTYISKISTYDEDKRTLLVYPYPFKTF